MANGFNFGDIFGHAAQQAAVGFAEQLGIQLVERQLVLPASSLQGIADAANLHLVADAPTETPLTPAQVAATDKAIIEYVAKRVAAGH